LLPDGSLLGSESYTVTDRSTVGESEEQILALKQPATRWTVLDLFSIGLARFFIIEEDPLVAPFSPPELSPKFVCLPARTI